MHYCCWLWCGYRGSYCDSDRVRNNYWKRLWQYGSVSIRDWNWSCSGGLVLILQSLYLLIQVVSEADELSCCFL